jgi:hypothetical protein
MILIVKPIKYTRHARNRMRLHKILENEIELAIKEPAYLEPSKEGRFNSWVETSGKFLRVTYNEDENRFLVISAVRKKRGWR